MSDIEIYLRRFHYSRTKISKERYLQFHIDAYLSEIYILRERLLHYIKLVERAYRRDPNLTGVKDACAWADKAVTEAFKSIVAIRSRHVHEARFEDEGIDRLSTIALFKEHPDGELSKLFRSLYETEYRKIRKQWVELVATSNRHTLVNLDQVFAKLFPIVFENETTLRVPYGVR